MNPSPSVPAFPLTPAHSLHRRAPENLWLVEQLWAEEAVGILGGEPKCCKSMFALHVALAVASGRPCLQRFAVAHPGPVIVYHAEDPEHIVSDRVCRIAAGAELDLAKVPLSFITTATLRLDRRDDCDALDATIASVKPRLVILDPFVRLHRIDENISCEVAPLLAELRALQRRHHTAILLVHHSRKGGAVRAGQALRGSSEFHAWGDCNLYLRRRAKLLTLSAEHRAAPEPDDLALELHQDDDCMQLRVLSATNADPTVPSDPRLRLLEHLRSTPGPLSRQEIRTALGIRNASLGELLEQLHQESLIYRHDDGRYSACPAEAVTTTP